LWLAFACEARSQSTTKTAPPAVESLSFPILGSRRIFQTTATLPGMSQMRTVCATFCDISKIVLAHSRRVVTAFMNTTTTPTARSKVPPSPMRRILA
jgi:hypothetical protein